MKGFNRVSTVLGIALIATVMVVRDFSAVFAVSTALPEADGPYAAATATQSATYGAGGAAYNLRITSDASPDLTDLQSLIHSTTSQWASARDKVWSLFYWTHILKRQTPPIVLHGLEVTDPIRNLTDYGYTMCSTISGINQTLYEALGLPHQYWDICNHTVSTVAYDGKFRVIDSSMSNLVTTDDGVTLASLQEAAADFGRLVRQRSANSTSPNGFLSGTDALRHLADAVNPANGTVVKGFAANYCANSLKHRDYFYNWDAGHRYVLNLREHESYTRYYRRLGSTPDYWVGSERISAPNPDDEFEIDPSGRFGNRGNGHWSFTPSLSPTGWNHAAHAATNIFSPDGGGLQPAVAASPAEVVYKVQAANAIASQKITATFTMHDPAATGGVSISLNHGLTWTDVASVGQQSGVVPLTVNLRDEVNGAYETLIRFRMTAPIGGSAAAIVLNAVAIDTLTHLNVHALPKLNIGRNEIFVNLGDQSDTMVLWPDLRGTLWRDTAFEASNIATQDVSVPREYTAVAYPSVATQDAHLTYRMDVPRDLTRVVYGGRLYNPTPDSYIDFLHSFDEGATWIRSYRLSDVSKPYDVIHYETVTDIPPGVRTVRFRFLIHSTGTGTRSSGFYSLRMEANHQTQTPQPAPVEVTLRWKEVQANRTTILRSHKQVVDRFPMRYVVNVAGSDHPVMEAMTVNVVGSGDGAALGYSDGIDVGGAKYVHTTRTDGVNLAQDRPYTFSRAPSGFQYSAGATNQTILTDGVVGAPGTGGISYWWGQCWSSGTDVDIQVDLGSPRTIGAVRAHLFGYPGWDALKGQVQDRIEIQSSLDGVEFVSHGVLQTGLWQKDIPMNYMLPDDGKVTAWNFERIAPSPFTARYVRYHITPKRILCASELQVIDRVTYQSATSPVAPPKWASEPPVSNVPPNVVITSPQSGTTLTAPAAVTLAAHAADPDDGVELVEFFANGLPVGQTSVSPYAISWVGIPAGQYTVTARATDFAGASTPSAAVVVTVESGAALSRPGDEIVLHAAVNPHIIGGWEVTSDSTAASGARLQNPNANVAKVLTPLSAPTQAFELAFDAEADRPYRLWLRGKALANSYTNDSVYVQFDRSVDAAGNPIWRIGTASATTVVLEECGGCGVQEWGWADNGYGPDVLGPLVYFAASGPQRIRVQMREDGLGIDQVVLSAVEYANTAPGAAKNDATILEPTGSYAESLPADEVVLYAAADAQILGAWTVVADASAASGARVQNPNANAPKLSAPSPEPTQAFDLTFSANAGKPYRLWIRGKAENDSYSNDSVFVQFETSVDQSGAPVWRIGTPSATSVVLEQCGGCGVQGWGWTDNGYGVLGPVVYFAQSGPQRLRIQVREDGLGIDQVVLSAVKYFSTSPGSPYNDTLILPR